MAVNLRRRPANASDVVAVVSKGQTVQVIGRDGGRLQVEYADPRRSHDGLTGSVYGRFLHRADGPPTRAPRPTASGRRL